MVVSLFSEILAQPETADADLSYIMAILNEEMDGLPPGGGLSSK